MSNNRSLLGFLGTCLMVIPLMGNQSCENPQAEARYLKKKVELGKVQGRTFTLPGGETFDFDYVINAQAFEVLSNSKDFILPMTAGTNSIESAGVFGDGSIHTFAVEEPVPACAQDFPNMKIGGTVNGFEFTTGVGVKFGFTKDSDIGKGTSVGVKVKVDISQLDLTLTGYDPLSRAALGSGNAKSNETKTSIGVDVDFSQFSVGPEFFFKSPLASVTRKGLELAIANLSKEPDVSNDPWVAQVIEDKDSHVIINAGSRSLIRKGDKFSVYNVKHFFQNKECASPHMGYAPTTDVPLLEVQVMEDGSVGRDLTRAAVLSRYKGYTAMKGAVVTIRELYKAPAK